MYPINRHEVQYLLLFSTIWTFALSIPFHNPTSANYFGAVPDRILNQCHQHVVVGIITQGYDIS